MPRWVRKSNDEWLLLIDDKASYNAPDADQKDHDEYLEEQSIGGRPVKDKK